MKFVFLSCLPEHVPYPNSKTIRQQFGYGLCTEKGSTEETRVHPEKRRVALPVITALLCAATVVLAVLIAFMQQKLDSATQAQEAILSEVERQNDTISEQEKAIAALESKLNSSSSDPDQHIAERLDEHEKLIGELSSRINGGPDGGNAVHFISHTVVSGDTLRSICSDNNIDYHANKSIVLAVNGIKDADNIKIGQVILLPVTD